MINLDTDPGQMVIRSIITLGHKDPVEWKTVCGWINDSLEILKNEMIDVRGDNTLLAQGYADALRDVSEAFNNPHGVLKAIKARKHREELGKQIKTW